MQSAFGETINKEYNTIGEPVSITDAETLAEDDPYQFQFWSLGLVGARPAEAKRGPDKGVDGRMYFHDEGPGGSTKQMILSVKAGKLKAEHVRDLRGVVERESAQIGVLISLHPATRGMRAEAASAGTYESPWGKHPRLQLVTVEELLSGHRLDTPPIGPQFKTAPKKSGATEQQKLL